MQDTETLQTSGDGTDEFLPSTNTELTESEENVVNHLATVSAQSTEFDGMCGRVTNVQFEEEVEEPEELRAAVQKLSQRSDRAQDQVIDTGVADDIAKVQDELREMVGLKPRESREIIVTVQLPDGRTFNQKFEAPTFDADGYENKFQTLYNDILGLDELRQEGIVGEVVPVKELETRSNTDGAKYEIDFSYADNSTGLSTSTGTSVADRIESVLSGDAGVFLMIAGLFYGLVFMIVFLSQTGVF